VIADLAARRRKTNLQLFDDVKLFSGPKIFMNENTFWDGWKFSSLDDESAASPGRGEGKDSMESRHRFRGDFHQAGLFEGFALSALR
jgi:hypothetical protein